MTSASRLAFAGATLLVTMSCAQSSPGDDGSSHTRNASDSRSIQRAAPTVFDLPSQWRTIHGDSMRLRQFAGRVNVVAMIYTSCQMTCPLIMADLRRIDSRLTPAERQQVQFLLVSLDPDRDTPGRLLAWSDEQQLDTTRWRLLTGTDHDTRALAATLDVRYQRQADGEIAHTNGFTVLNHDGHIIEHHAGLGATEAITVSIRRAVGRIAP